jgi:hypothetical protein
MPLIIAAIAASARYFIAAIDAAMPRFSIDAADFSLLVFDIFTPRDCRFRRHIAAITPTLTPAPAPTDSRDTLMLR